MIRKIKDKKTLVLVIACIIITGIFLFRVSESRYILKITAEDNIIAIPVLTLSNNTQTYSITNMLPGEEEYFEFYVSNTDENNKNEVPLTYYFKIDMSSELPLQIKLYDITNGTEKELEINNNITEKMQMNIVRSDEEKVTRAYRLKVLWDKVNKDSAYAGKNINCNITLEGIQEN